MSADRTGIEPIIEPELPIVDAHHHLWIRSEAALAAIENDAGVTAQALAPTFRRHARYLVHEFAADLKSGHNVKATVYVEADAMYRVSGPEQMKSVGEVEFANGMAAIAASGLFGEINICAGIVGGVDLRLGDAVKEVLLAQMQAGGERYRGIRPKAVVYDEDPRTLGHFGGAPGVLLDRHFRAGFKHLEPLGLSFDAWQLEYQLGELIDLVHAFPHTQVIVNHTGGLFGLGRYAGRTQERFDAWRENMRMLSRCPNVTVKLGGLGMPMCGFQSSFSATPPSSADLAREWRPYIETCIEAFGAGRCMFESNFPVDASTTTYPVLWNAFKLIVSGASKDEKMALFSGTAARIYRLHLSH
jgi:predicted TIM-barrel fold metal-dependent hydrolase